MNVLKELEIPEQPLLFLTEITAHRKQGSPRQDKEKKEEKPNDAKPDRGNIVRRPPNKLSRHPSQNRNRKQKKTEGLDGIGKQDLPLGSFQLYLLFSQKVSPVLF